MSMQEPDISRKDWEAKFKVVIECTIGTITLVNEGVKVDFVADIPLAEE